MAPDRKDRSRYTHRDSFSNILKLYFCLILVLFLIEMYFSRCLLKGWSVFGMKAFKVCTGIDTI